MLYRTDHTPFVPAKAGIQIFLWPWVPAFAGTNGNHAARFELNVF
jgi:hypothetical protein